MPKTTVYYSKKLSTLLDLYPNALAGYSFRLLRVGYTGSCCRVRRSSDNAELDIDFVSGYIDLATMATFVGASNGFIVRIYDQSGNANNILQTSGAAQPKIINAGTMQTKNGFAAPVFTGSQILVTSTSILSAYPFTNFLVASDSGGVNFIVSGSEDTSTNFMYFADYINVSPNGGYLREADGTTTRNLVVGTFASDTMRQLCARHINTTDKEVMIDGTSATSSSFANTIFPIDNYAIGGIARPAIVYGAGYFLENILYANDQNANKVAINLNQKTYFGTP